MSCGAENSFESGERRAVAGDEVDPRARLGLAGRLRTSTSLLERLAPDRRDGDGVAQCHSVEQQV